MTPQQSSAWDRALAKVCLTCPVCRRARKKQAGLAHRFVRTVEGGLCPFCRAYARVHGRRSYERVPPAPQSAPEPL